jgi:ribose 1,5-bisphosphate isomerase
MEISMREMGRIRHEAAKLKTHGAARCSPATHNKPVRPILERAEVIAGDRTRGASELAAELLPVLEAAQRAGRDTMVEVVRCVCRGQPAMAVLWNICAAVVADMVAPGRFARVRAEVERAPDALARAATSALNDALVGVPAPRILTLSYSRSVARTLTVLRSTHQLDVICGESLPAREGLRLADELVAAGIVCELVIDSALTTYLPEADAVVVGADAVAARHWTNKAGTFGLAAAAWFAGVPVYVVVSRDKAEAASLTSRITVPRLFEHIPSELATLFLTDAGPIAPESLSALTERFASDLDQLFAYL